jgi:hypothetical protein
MYTRPVNATARERGCRVSLNQVRSTSALFLELQVVLCI